MPTSFSSEVIIIGAGPYGLSTAAHLGDAGVPFRIFGEPMEFWQHQMPRGMLLRSAYGASHIADPRHAYSLDAFQTQTGVRIEHQVPLEGFVRYGQWVQKQVAPKLERRWVRRVEPVEGGLQLEMEDGDVIAARQVVVAGGIAPFAQRPPEFDQLPAGLASHSADHNDMSPFAGRRVVVVGGGQSAFESAALLSECDADVELIMREPQVRWLNRSGLVHKRMARRILYAPSDVGPMGLSWLVAAPDLFTKLPRDMQDRLAYRCIRPAASSWLQPRTRRIRITTGRRVALAAPAGDTVQLALDDGSIRRADHVLLATGYRVDVARYPFLGPRLVEALQRINGYPELAQGFESSVPGLHFVGAPSAWSFGPVMRFVAGTVYTGPALTRRIQMNRRN
jgi:lysine/ornithine N-monooxygenase